MMIGTVAVDTLPASASHGTGDPDANPIRSVEIVVDAAPITVGVHEPNVPDDCWTLQEFPYTRTAFFDRHEECVAPWVSTHHNFTFNTEADATYVLWFELLAPGMPAQFFPPTTEVYVELHSENRWLGFQSPLVDLENQAYGHTESSRWVEDLSVLARWGWNDDVHIDHRTPTDQGIRNRAAHAFTTKEAGTWRFSVGGTNPLPPGTYPAGDNIRVWLQRLDGEAPESTVWVFDRFEYPPADQLVIEHGATAFREFEVLDSETQEPVSGMVVELSPTGGCDTRIPGRMSCFIETSELLEGSQLFSFTSATRDGEKESTADWPSFGFTTKKRDITTKAEMTLNASAKGEFGVGISLAGESGLSMEIKEDNTFKLESTEATALGFSGSTGIGGGIKLGWISPRAKAEIEGELELKAFETVAIDITDAGDLDQQLAMGAFLLEKVFSLRADIAGGPIEYLVDAFNEDVLREHYLQYLAADEFGLSGTAKLSGKLGIFTANRPGLGAFNYGLGVTANGAVSGTWKFDRKTGDHALVLQASAGGAGILNLSVIPIYFEDERLDYNVTGNLSVEMELTFDGPPTTGRLKTVKFTLKSGTTWAERIESDALILEFDADQLNRAGNIVGELVRSFADPTAGVTFSPEVITEIFEHAVKNTEGTVTVKKTKGTGFRPSLAFGEKILIGISIKGEVEVGGDWRLTVGQKTQDWRLLTDNDGERGLVQISEFPFEDTTASTQTATEIVGPILADALAATFPGATGASWVIKDWLAGDELSVDASTDNTETALININGGSRTVRDALDQEITELQVAARVWSALLLPEWVIPGGSLGPAGDARNFQVAYSSHIPRFGPPHFHASEFMDVGPFGVTVDPPIEISLSYLSEPDNPDDLLVYRHAGNGVWEPLPTEIDAANKVATAQITEFGTFVVGLDSTAPEIEPVVTQAGFTAFIGDAGSGVDPESISLTVDGESTLYTYNAPTGLFATRGPLPDGAEFVLTASDRNGNQAVHESTVEGLPAEDSVTTGTGDISAQATATPQVLFTTDSGEPAESGDGGGSLALIIVLIVLAVLAAAGGAGWYFWKQSARRPAAT